MSRSADNMIGTDEVPIRIVTALLVVTALTIGPLSALAGVEPTATPTPPISVNTACYGDCNGDGRVSVDELMTLINIVLGNFPVDACPLPRDCCHPCPPGVYIDCMLVAISNALTGCPMPSPTPTPTPTSELGIFLTCPVTPGATAIINGTPIVILALACTRTATPSATPKPTSALLDQHHRFGMIFPA